MDKINILGINIDNLDKKQVLAKIEQFLAGDEPNYIVTPNPEIILAAQKDEEFFYILNKADLAIPDGVGLKFAGWAMGKNIKRITGTDLVRDILDELGVPPIRRAGRNNELRIGIINWRGGLSKEEDLKTSLQKIYSDIQFYIQNIDRKGRLFNLEGMNSFQPNILFVALGAPWQEKFIYHNLKRLPSVKLAIGVGGAFDFLTGRIKRAPRFMQIIGLEWLWRLFKQPWRAKRIWKAVVVFPLEFFKWRFVLPFFYRPNVACLLYKKENDKHKIFLVERSSDKGHWQLPQGGTDGYDLFTAGAKELSEESGTDKFRLVKVFKNVYRYKFGEEKGRANIFCRHIYGYRGQKQGLFIAEFIGQDEDIKISFWDHSGWKWVAADRLVDEVHQIRKEGVKIFLEKFRNLDKQFKLAKN
ncbi:hypothetical protein COV49_00395 [Candidatus Falkowbacteria bacterium CG11_big_fil_rev_8_21_14_0_20_39_10]|uniref:Nudix hydrolase domain-containing protein n=1 Tax=Candidatus Falkowbacteria bacterium CG11_big_fil_rev_8_21_14_0_20_39_10 TaxID=1974570 RepID=A0A2M6KA77_9BACT|nr:MAG: hypothetical protein COV49_00395 [Candidatus Falkowbacteria bacterium CG11_big_fil_rev_8_21_14_0_20_39_10]